MQFKPTKPVKQTPPLSVGIAGLPGAGKTQGALELASTLGKRTAIVSTERHGANWQIGHYQFEQIVWQDVMPGSKPFVLEKLIQCLHDLIGQGYDCIIVDMFSEWWEGPGGILGEKKRSFSEWGEVRERCQPLHDLMKDPPVNLIFTMQAKRGRKQVDMQNPDGSTRYRTDSRGDVVRDRKGKPVAEQEVLDFGITPIMRDDLFKPLHLVYILDEDHSFTMLKDKLRLWEQNLPGDTINKDYCAALVKFLGSGNAVVEAGEEMEFVVSKTTYIEKEDIMLLVCANEMLKLPGLDTALPVGDCNLKIKATVTKINQINAGGRKWDAFLASGYEVIE